eukprot:TRINITY_DN11265_c0_g1_i1.p1 TRINITY_DN11265_c0_g1~~TRINITY_DN11265_c0_g1_i1.p1  ORF type:complete len:156 (+),score=37.65 TRINITY_DN11265_c0_g1_i1:47-469(+)
MDEIWVDPATSLVHPPHTSGTQKFFVDRSGSPSDPPRVYRETPDSFHLVGAIGQKSDFKRSLQQAVEWLSPGDEVRGRGLPGGFGVHFDPGNINLNAHGVQAHGPNWHVNYPHKDTLQLLGRGEFKAVFKKLAINKVNQL